MNRPLMQHGVGQLEQLFSVSKSDSKVLKQLEAELRYRQVPRAIALLAEVQAALYAAPVKESPRTSDTPTDLGGHVTAPPVQPPLWPKSAPGADAPGQEPESLPASGGTVLPRLAAAPTPAPAAEMKATRHREPSPEAPLVTLSDAYKVFKATAGSSWDAIEQTRRLLVQSASPTRVNSLPESERIAARAEARRVNAAYEVMSRARSSPPGS